MQTPHAADEKPSKTRRKREMHARQALGERLASLEDDVIAQLPLDERLVDALRAMRSLRSHEARRRQMQFIGRLMRDVDLDALHAALAQAGRTPQSPRSARSRALPRAPGSSASPRPTHSSRSTPST